jgi:DNA polymerase-3 subunit beta
MQENLARGLSVVSRAVSTRSTLPVLANVLLKTEDGGLRLTTTNLEIGLIYWVPGKIETTARPRSRPSCWTDPFTWRTGSARDRGRRDIASPVRPLESHVKASMTSSIIQTTGERPTTRISEGPEAGPEQTAFAAATEGAADPDRRPVAVRGRQGDLAAADNYRIAVKSIRSRPGRRHELSARPASTSHAVLNDTDDPVDVILTYVANRACSTSRDRPRQPAHRRRPELPVRAPKAHTTARSRRDELPGPFARLPSSPGSRRTSSLQIGAEGEAGSRSAPTPRSPRA